jgi:hypothetical protein
MIVVTDTGIGITRSHRLRLFEPFTQADSASTRSKGGTGLGLVLVGRLTELMEGKIDVESTPGMGSSFRVILPLQECETRSQAVATATPVTENRTIPREGLIAVITPVRSLSRLVLRLLEKDGWQVRAAESLEEALSERWEPVAVVFDSSIGQGSSVECFAQIREAFPSAEYVSIDAGSTESERIQMQEMGLKIFWSRNPNVMNIRGLSAMLEQRSARE